MVGLPASEGPVGKTEVTVVQGRVDVEPPKAAAATEKPVVLTAGSQLTSQVGDTSSAKAVKVDAQQMAQIRESVKVTDNTFSKAVVVEPVASNGSGGGEATRSALGCCASAVQVTPPVAVGTAGFAGTFGANQTFQPTNVNFQQANMLRTISVTVIGPQ